MDQNNTKKNSNIKLVQQNINNLNNTEKQTINFYITHLNTIKEHKDWIESVKIFPSGNIISASYDCSIKIYDGINYNILQNIEKAHQNVIFNIYIKDENNFASCSLDRYIKIWKKENNKYILYNQINNKNYNKITNLIYFSNNNIIACSDDSYIKVWNLINNKYQLLTTFTHSKHLNSLLNLEDKNILVSSGHDGTILWKMFEKGMNIDFFYYFKEAICGCWNGLNRIKEDIFIVGGEETLNIISIKEKEIIKSIKIPFRCNGIITIEEKGIFLMGGWNCDILIYRSDNYEYLTTIKEAHSKYIVGFCKLNHNLFLSFSGDTTMKIWLLNSKL